MAETIVSLATSSDPDYAFPAVFACLFWRDVVGHDPRILLVGDETEWSSGRPGIALESFRKHEIDHRFFPRLPGHHHGQVAQNARHHVAADESIADDAWIMLSDADLWPLRGAWYRQHGTQRLVSYYANGDHFQGKEATLALHDSGGSFQSIPTCHVALRARDWRKLYDIAPGDAVGSVRRAMEDGLRPIRDLHPDQRGWIDWMGDQWFMTERLCRQDWFPASAGPFPNEEARIDIGDATFVTRCGHAPLNRLCRSVPENWSRNYRPEPWLDAHVHKGSEKPGTWETTLPIIAAHMPQHVEWAEAYREAWIR